MARLQVVVGDTRAEMVDVMIADVAREPLQQAGQLVIRTAGHRGHRIIPLFVPLPINPFILMLHIKVLLLYIKTI